MGPTSLRGAGSLEWEGLMYRNWRSSKCSSLILSLIKGNHNTIRLMSHALNDWMCVWCVYAKHKHTHIIAQCVKWTLFHWYFIQIFPLLIYVGATAGKSPALSKCEVTKISLQWAELRNVCKGSWGKQRFYFLVAKPNYAFQSEDVFFPS